MYFICKKLCGTDRHQVIISHYTSSTRVLSDQNNTWPSKKRSNLSQTYLCPASTHVTLSYKHTHALTRDPQPEKKMTYVLEILRWTLRGKGEWRRWGVWPWEEALLQRWTNTMTGAWAEFIRRLTCDKWCCQLSGDTITITCLLSSSNWCQSFSQTGTTRVIKKQLPKWAFVVCLCVCVRVCACVCAWGLEDKASLLPFFPLARLFNCPSV